MVAVASRESRTGCGNCGRMEEVQKQISSLQAIIHSSSLANLPDGGAKVHDRMASLQKELVIVQGKGDMQHLTCSAGLAQSLLGFL